MQSLFALNRGGEGGATQVITNYCEAPLFLSSEKAFERRGEERKGGEGVHVCVGGGHIV